MLCREWRPIFHPWHSRIISFRKCHKRWEGRKAGIKEGTREKAHKKSPEEVQHPVLNRVCFLMKPALHCRTKAISLWSPQPAAHSILASREGHRTHIADKVQHYLENQSWSEETLKSRKSILWKKKSYACFEIHFLQDLLWQNQSECGMMTFADSLAKRICRSSQIQNTHFLWHAGKVLCGRLVVRQPKNCRPLTGNNHMNYQSHTRPISLLKFYLWNTEQSAYMNVVQEPWEMNNVYFHVFYWLLSLATWLEERMVSNI